MTGVPGQDPRLPDDGEERGPDEPRDGPPGAQSPPPEGPPGPPGGSGDADIDARFAEIVAAYRAQPTLGQGPRQTGGQDPQPGREPGPPVGPAGGGPPRGPLEAVGAGAPETDAVPGDQGWRGWSEDDDDHFVPPDPPPLPAGDLHFWGILVGLGGGLLLLILGPVVGVLSGEVWTWLGLGMAVGGFVLLVLRLPTHRDDDPSGGARV